MALVITVSILLIGATIGSFIYSIKEDCFNIFDAIMSIATTIGAIYLMNSVGKGFCFSETKTFAAAAICSFLAAVAYVIFLVFRNKSWSEDFEDLLSGDVVVANLITIFVTCLVA